MNILLFRDIFQFDHILMMWALGAMAVMLVRCVIFFVDFLDDSDICIFYLFLIRVNWIVCGLSYCCFNKWIWAKYYRYEKYIQRLNGNKISNNKIISILTLFCWAKMKTISVIPTDTIRNHQTNSSTSKQAYQFSK